MRFSSPTTSFCSGLQVCFGEENLYAVMLTQSNVFLYTYGLSLNRNNWMKSNSWAKESSCVKKYIVKTMSIYYTNKYIRI